MGGKQEEGLDGNGAINEARQPLISWRDVVGCATLDLTRIKVYSRKWLGLASKRSPNPSAAGPLRLRRRDIGGYRPETTSSIDPGSFLSVRSICGDDDRVAMWTHPTIYSPLCHFPICIFNVHLNPIFGALSPLKYASNTEAPRGSILRQVCRLRCHFHRFHNPLLTTTNPSSSRSAHPLT